MGRVRTGRHSAHIPHAHLVIVTKYRHRVFSDSHLRRLEGVSSRSMREEFPDLRFHYSRANRLWSVSYFAGSVSGAPLSIVKQYIEQQARPV
ncbi:MAG: transposase [Candidatus Nanopelagicales bacterium]|nr:transposase [Candidatus Nanopelagicales bacterium]MDZ4250446.1 transposase [Candidatus Nanopelagicales bacterium]MDZ7578335.1 transposase [Candidatus Nanopelagicales bacterium]